MEFRIKEMMKMRGVKTQKELAKQIGMSPSVFCKFVNGSLKTFNMEVLDQIAEILDCEPADLIAKEDGKDQPLQFVCPHCGQTIYVSSVKPKVK